VRVLVYPEGQRPENPDLAHMAQDLRVTPDYFRAMGIRVLAGRPPRPESESGGVREVAISESLARLYWPDVSALGKRLEAFNQNLEVVGVVADVRPTSIEAEFIPQAYYPMMDAPYAHGALIVRGSAGGDELARWLQQAVRDVAPTQAAYNVRSMDEVISGAIRTRRTNTALITTFGILALGLAAVGVYGVMAYSMARRTREIGIRMALGARAARVMGSVLREGLVLALVGTALGLAGAWGLSRVMEGLLYGVTTRDPLTFVLAPVALLVAALAAAAIPAWRATRVNPVDAMRSE
jgi:predicted permease